MSVEMMQRVKTISTFILTLTIKHCLGHNTINAFAVLIIIICTDLIIR